MEILLATNNRHKKEELGEILTGHRILLPSDIGIRFECDETGNSYHDNALLKGETLYKLTGKPVLADDSGLSVKILDGAPGIHSARFGEETAGRSLSDSEKYERLLDRLSGEKDRTAFFVCCLVLVTGPWRHFSVQETLVGEILTSPSGSGGFGYDPVFRPECYTVSLAELPATEKNRISHRGRAGRMILPLINGFEG
jgi:XTP/dITP diphosphohydrolase